MSDNKENATNDEPCDGCGIVQSRRVFLRDSAIAALVVSMGAMGVSARKAAAMNVGFVTGKRSKSGGPQTVTYPLPATDGAQIDHDNEVILVRWQDAVYAFNLSCPHQRTALRWDDADHRFQCPKHHSKYQPDGEFISGRATRNMDRFTLKRDASNAIVVDVDSMLRSDQDLAAWTAAMLKV